MLSFVGSFWCESIQFTTNGDWVGTIDFTPSDIQLGPWNQKDTELVSRKHIDGSTNYFVRDVCTDFSNPVDIDSKWKTARAFSIITPIMGGLLVFVLFINNCTYYFSEPTWKKATFIFLIILPLFQGLSFLLLSSNACKNNPLLSANPSPDTVSNDVWAEWIQAAYPNDECSWDAGMTSNVISTVFYCVTALCMVFTGVPTRPPESPPETQEVTYERQVGPDGTVSVVQTNVVKGAAVPSSLEGNPMETAAPPATSEIP
jgi:hypothetical protein